MKNSTAVARKPDTGEAAQSPEIFDSSFCSMDYHSENGKVPWRLKYFGGVHLENLYVFRVTGVGVRSVVRSQGHIKANPVSDFLLCIPIDSKSFVIQAGRQTYCEPGSFRIHSTCMPFSASACGKTPHSQYSQIMARIPGAILRQLVPDIDALSNVSVKFRPGAGKIMKSMIELALDEGNAISSPQSRVFGNAIIHAIAAALLDDAPELVLLRAQAPRPTRSRTIETAIEFIERNLSDPALDCGMVASHCGVSKTSLHVAFAASSMKVSSFIRELRLKHCREALQNPALRQRLIAEIAMSWGFADPTLFSRLYRERFGKSAREERRCAFQIADPSAVMMA